MQDLQPVGQLIHSLPIKIDLVGQTLTHEPWCKYVVLRHSVHEVGLQSLQLDCGHYMHWIKAEFWYVPGTQVLTHDVPLLVFQGYEPLISQESQFVIDTLHVLHWGAQVQLQDPLTKVEFTVPTGHTLVHWLNVADELTE